MKRKLKPNFEFYNNISPKYIEPLFLQLEYGQWYDSEHLKKLLRANGLQVEGSEIVERNTTAWYLIGLGQIKTESTDSRFPKRLFQLTSLGKQVIDTYGTNQELFYDLMHFLFYSTWCRSQDVWRGRFWLYTQVCDVLWTESPSQMDSFALTNRLQAEIMDAFPEYEPAFPERSVRAVFPWLGALKPPFLSKRDARSQLYSQRRDRCTPQLFHLATDLVYTNAGLKYGTSMATGEPSIEAICKICLLAPTSFWQMADLTKLTIRGYEIRKGQWGTSIALEGPPTWIELPDLAQTVSADGGEE